MSTTEILVGVPLGLDPAAAIAAAGGEAVRVHHRPDLLAPQRWVADHRGDPAWARSAEQEAEWRELVSRCDVLLGIPGDSSEGLHATVTANPHLRWVQGTAAGAGEQLAGAGLSGTDLERVAVTSAAGVHGSPLAEFAIFGLLAFAKDVDVLIAAQQRREWLPRWTMRSLAGQRLLVLGGGGIGREVARRAAALGMDVTQIRRSGPLTLADLDELLPAADAVVSTLPGTDATRGLLDARRLRLLPRHAVLVNVGRGSVVVTEALVAALRDGALRGAVLDVADPEPLPADSPLWDLPNVIISPHTAALTTDEDDRIVALFCDNLRRFLQGEPLINLVDIRGGY